MASSAAPLNDDLANARPITAATTSQSTVGATTQTGEDLVAEQAQPVGSTVWFNYTAPVSGAVTIDTNGSGYDTTLQVFSLTNPNLPATQSNLTEITSNDDNGTSGNINNPAFYASTVQFNATAGQVYYVQAGGASGDSGNLVLHANPVCFASETMILTARGDVAVENLLVGDLAVTVSGAHRPIRWIGSRLINCRRYPEPAVVMPVCIRAGALGDNRPVRDLVVSPGHAICFDVLGEVLVPASALVNGSTIVQEDVDSVTYWHVELDSHDILIAEGQPAESYLDMGNRTFFAESPVIDLEARPDATDAVARTTADFCRPFHDGGALVDALRARIRVRAESLGWSLVTPEAWSDVHLEVDGRIVQPKIRGLTACFALPADAKNVWLVSPTGVPSHVGDNPDGRALGLCLSDLSLSDGLGEVRSIALDAPSLCFGFHPAAADHRWTAGRAHLPTTLLEGMEGDVFLQINLLGPSLPRWVGPETAIADKSILEAPRLSVVAA